VLTQWYCIKFMLFSTEWGLSWNSYERSEKTHENMMTGSGQAWNQVHTEHKTEVASTALPLHTFLFQNSNFL